MGKALFATFGSAIDYSLHMLDQVGEDVDAGRWQGYATEGKPDLMTKEILDLSFRVEMPEWIDSLVQQISPNLPWADDHFEERVGGTPMNPDPSYKDWPWWQGQESSKQAGEQFTHTYSERFWPRYANYLDGKEFRERQTQGRVGIRYRYGDLSDVIDLLVREPFGRQAYLPIFFPEDTGAVHRGRIPCTLGYHFMRRGNQLHMWYHIRSCDAVRHFRDDLYLAARLLMWVRDVCQYRDKLNWLDVRPGVLHFTAYSFHVHYGDYHLLKEQVS